VNNSVLNSPRTRLAGWLALRGVLALLAILGTAAMALILLDAALDLPESLRAAASWILGLCGVTVLAVALWQWRKLNERRVARLFERTEPWLGDRLTNAVQLALQSSASGVEEFLRREAVELGRKAAAGLKTWPVVRRKMGFAGAAAGAAILAWCCLVWLGGEVSQAVFPRFLDPHGDHPPYSKLKIEVLPGQATVLFGGQIEVRAAAHGHPVEKLWLVATAANNTARTIMFLSPDKSFFQTLANLREPAVYFVTDGQARSRRFPISIRYTPQITLVEITTTFPDYTARASRTAKLADEPQAFPEDTRIAFRIASNRPLKSGALTLTPVLGGKPIEVELKPEAEQNMIVSGSFALTVPVAFALSVRDVDGLDCTAPRRGRFNIAPDERPRLFVLEPGRNAVATPSIRVPVKVQAQDDYGITRVVWLRGHNRSIERPLNMKLTLKGGPQSVEAAGALELDKLGVRPGDVIDYYFEAADNYPKGPNVELSRPYRLDIISDEQYKQILKQAAARKALFEPYFKIGAWLRRLAEHSRGVQSKAEKSDSSARDEANALAEQMEKYDRELATLLQNPLMFDVEQSFRDTLSAQQARIGEAKKKLKQALGSGQLDPKQLKELAEELSQLSQTEEEQIGQPAQQIASVVQVMSRADAFVRLAQQQAAIAQMLRRFADRTNALSRIEQMEVQELAHQQERTRDALKALVMQLPELLAKVPPDAEYDSLRTDVNGFLKAVVDAKIETDLADAAKVLGEPDPMTGYVLAQRAAEKMDALVGKCNGMSGQQCLTARFRPKLSKPGMGNTVQQILAAMNQGNGQGGSDGYGMFNEDVALYGPNVELAGEQAGGRRENEGGSGQGRQIARVTGDVRDPALGTPAGPGRVRLQPDAKFPLRYRELVGEYFRAIAEAGTDEGGKK